MTETLFERRSEAEEHYQRGLQLKRRGFLLEAEQEFRLSLETDPSFFDPLLELLIEQEETGISEDIRSDQLLKRADQKYKLGMALLKHRRPEKAVRHLQAACDLESDNARYLCGLAEALEKAGRREDAREKLRIAANAAGGSEPVKYRARAHYLLGKLHLKEGHLHRARRRLLTAYSLDPDCGDVSTLLRRAKVGKLRQMLMMSKLKKAGVAKKNISANR
jgi:tetratricopeptide (TPR) repeat protein